MEYKVHTVILQGDSIEEWAAFLCVIERMEPEYVFDILEHYDLENWL